MNPGLLEADSKHAGEEPSRAPDATWSGIQGERAVSEVVVDDAQGPACQYVRGDALGFPCKRTSAMEPKPSKILRISSVTSRGSRYTCTPVSGSGFKVLAWSSSKSAVHGVVLSDRFARFLTLCFLTPCIFESGLASSVCWASASSRSGASSPLCLGPTLPSSPRLLPAVFPVSSSNLRAAQERSQSAALPRASPRPRYHVGQNYSERFMGTWQGRGDRSVFVTSHRPVHCSRALCCHSDSSYCVTSVSCRTGVWFSFTHRPHQFTFLVSGPRACEVPC